MSPSTATRASVSGVLPGTYGCICRTVTLHMVVQCPKGARLDEKDLLEAALLAQFTYLASWGMNSAPQNPADYLDSCTAR